MQYIKKWSVTSQRRSDIITFASETSFSVCSSGFVARGGSDTGKGPGE